MDLYYVLLVVVVVIKIPDSSNILNKKLIIIHCIDRSVKAYNIFFPICRLLKVDRLVNREGGREGGRECR